MECFSLYFVLCFSGLFEQSWTGPGSKPIHGFGWWQISLDVNIILETFMDQAVWQFALFILPLHCEEKKSYSYLTCMQNNIIQF